jgi:methylmalonyl-CoA mutase, N-terminal domain
VTLVAQQPLNNVVRTAYQALAAVLGGTQSLHTNAYDETYALPTEESATLALRTQQILAEETGVAAVADPLGGSYYVEALTDRIEAEATAILRTIDDMGGIVRAVESGWPQREIARSAYRTQQQIDSGTRAVVGVNKHTSGGAAATSIPTLKIDDGPEQAQRAAVAELRARRDGTAVRMALDAVRAAAKTGGNLEAGGNLMEAVLEAARREATLGEICRIFREVFGEYRDPAEV